MRDLKPAAAAAQVFALLRRFHKLQLPGKNFPAVVQVLKYAEHHPGREARGLKITGVHVRLRHAAVLERLELQSAEASHPLHHLLRQLIVRLHEAQPVAVGQRHAADLVRGRERTGGLQLVIVHVERYFIEAGSIKELVRIEKILLALNRAKAQGKIALIETVAGYEGLQCGNELLVLHPCAARHDKRDSYN